MPPLRSSPTPWFPYHPLQGPSRDKRNTEVRLGMKTGRENPVPSRPEYRFFPIVFELFGNCSGSGRKRDRDHRERD
uniref:Uncharacterized protein n=1 Tax=Arundo donax TaxID=35708 RepID=A0A0A9DF39_ARUDO